MTDHERLDALIRRARAIGHCLIGCEIDGATCREGYAKEVERLRARAPFMGGDRPWLDSLCRYGGLTLSEGPNGLTAGFFRVSHEASLHLLHGPGDLVSDGFLTFADLSYLSKAAEHGAGPEVDVAFGFEATGGRRPGVYQHSRGEWAWVAGGFLDLCEGLGARRGIFNSHRH